jgi:hypothetical protein
MGKPNLAIVIGRIKPGRFAGHAVKSLGEYVGASGPIPAFG